MKLSNSRLVLAKFSVQRAYDAAKELHVPQILSEESKKNFVWN